MKSLLFFVKRLISQHAVRVGPQKNDIAKAFPVGFHDGAIKVRPPLIRTLWEHMFKINNNIFIGYKFRRRVALDFEFQ